MNKESERMKRKYDPSILTLTASPRFLTQANMQNRLKELEHEIERLTKIYNHLKEESV